MTLEDWINIEGKLKMLNYPVKLKCDGYKISIMLERTGQFKNAIFLYINNQIKGEWLVKECEESRRFYRKVTRSFLSRKQMEAFKKMSKKRQNELKIKTTYTYYSTMWTSFRALKKHLIEQNNMIELINDHDIGDTYINNAKE